MPCVIGASRIVGADHEHDRLGLESLAFAVLEAPQNALRGVAGDGEVGRFEPAEILIEHRLVGVPLHPPVGDGISVQQQIDVAFLRDLDEAFVARAHAQRGLRVSSGDIQARRLQHQQRLEFFQQRRGGRVVGVDPLLHGLVDLIQLRRSRLRIRHLGRHWSPRADYDRRKSPAPRSASPRGRVRRRRCLGRLGKCKTCQSQHYYTYTFHLHLLV